jgi:hypothetical protein
MQKFLYIQMKYNRPPAGDMWPNTDEPDEPEWVQNERTQFENYRDKNKDGRMDRSEVRDWILPPDYDHAEAEAKHLVFESDANRVSCLRRSLFTVWCRLTGFILSLSYRS